MQILTACDSALYLELNHQHGLEGLPAGGRKDFFVLVKQIMANAYAGYPMCHGTEDNATLMRELLADEWGEDLASDIVATINRITFNQHHIVAKTCR